MRLDQTQSLDYGTKDPPSASLPGRRRRETLQRALEPLGAHCGRVRREAEHVSGGSRPGYAKRKTLLALRSAALTGGGNQLRQAEILKPLRTQMTKSIEMEFHGADEASPPQSHEIITLDKAQEGAFAT